MAPEGLKPWWGQTKGQLISKANCQAVNSSKKQTNESVLLLCNVFLEEIEDTKKTFQKYLTFKYTQNQTNTSELLNIALAF